MKIATLKSFIPKAMHGPLRKVRQMINRRRYSGEAHECPLCGSKLRSFRTVPVLSGGFSYSQRNICPVCFSGARQRLIWLTITEVCNLLDSPRFRLLHFAPEFSLGDRLSRHSKVDYLSADLMSVDAMLSLDLRAIDLPDESVDAIICSHVLEHVDQDRQAMRELCRILRPGGWAILQVPLSDNLETEEDPTIKTPEARQAAYGQWDHVRLYGQDYGDRLREAGFELQVLRPQAELEVDAVRRYGLVASEDVYLCRKPKSERRTQAGE